MDYFEQKYGGSLIFEPQKFLDLFVELGYLEPELMQQWRTERRDLLNKLFTHDAPESRFFDLLSHHAKMVDELKGKFSRFWEDPGRMLLEEFTLFIPLLALHYCKDMQWTPEILHFIVDFMQFQCVAILHHVLGYMEVPENRIKIEIGMLINFRKAVLESIRLENFQILLSSWLELKSLGQGSLVFTFMIGLLPRHSQHFRVMCEMITRYTHLFENV